ncbi:Uncharacterised protein [Flavonifractor plautii]|uniref:Uncharacterized protein n=1 Tax=Flavonifractor plautii TaxID=292800 RepID=A0A174R852_FLAPL|nr:Uncharacterised protein [Flavonifractor plautii]
MGIVSSKPQSMAAWVGYQGRRVRASSRKVIASPRVAGLSHSASSSTPGSP